ncbi:MAG: hypothetical protein M3R53_07025 [Candidatus Eremiobacteraeota bacterium]|nr:hypothetical protein [Candidatus Eremiobacteraeota bacterium]
MTFSFNFSLLSFRSRAMVAMFALMALFAASTPAPARADGAASTRNIVLGAAAAVAGIVIYNNIHHKQIAHNTIVGRTNDGGVVYADGRIVYPNGNVLYTSNGNGRVCSYVNGYGERCGAQPVAYHPARTYANRGQNWDRDRDEDHDRGHHYGQRKEHHGHDRDDRDNGGERGDHGD